jgi:hypothetical protein
VALIGVSLNSWNFNANLPSELTGKENTMTWIKTVPLSEADEKLIRAMEDQKALYPVEYATPVWPTKDGSTSGIVASHSLIPEALHHAFCTFGALMSPDLPLSRRQHEMITTVVSVTNRCFY